MSDLLKRVNERKLPVRGPELEALAKILNRPAEPEASENWLGNRALAELQARQIEEYWRDRGFFKVKTWVVKEGVAGSRPVYGVRSNLPRALS